MRIAVRYGVKFPALFLRHFTAFVLKYEVGRAYLHRLAAYLAGYAVGDDILHLAVQLIVAQPQLLCPAHNGVGHGVREVFLKAGGQAQHLAAVPPAEGDYIHHLRAGPGEGAGLVEHDGVCRGHGLQELSALDGYVMRAALPHGREHCQRHGQLERAGEVYHQH